MPEPAARARPADLPHDLREIRMTDSGRDAADDVAREILRPGSTTKASRVTARRRLEHLCADGPAEPSMRYGSAGRPEHLPRRAA